MMKTAEPLMDQDFGYPDTIPTDFDTLYSESLSRLEQEESRGSVQMVGAALLWAFCVICIAIPLAIHFWQRAQ